MSNIPKAYHLDNVPIKKRMKHSNPKKHPIPQPDCYLSYEPCRECATCILASECDIGDLV